MKTVHEPIRECICCGDKFPKASLIRVVKNDSGIFRDVSGKQNGRGAYLCGKPACLDRLIKQKRLNRAFKMNVSEDVYQALIKEIEENNNSSVTMTE